MKPIAPVEIETGNIYAMFNRAFLLQWLVVFQARSKVSITGECLVSVIINIQFKSDVICKIHEFHTPNSFNLQVIKKKYTI